MKKTKYAFLFLAVLAVLSLSVATTTKSKTVLESSSGMSGEFSRAKAAKFRRVTFTPTGMCGYDCGPTNQNQQMIATDGPICCGFTVECAEQLRINGCNEVCFQDNHDPTCGTARPPRE
jgi:hypothetical protein